jgi:tetratricopeptide (TPR) repeat protein
VLLHRGELEEAAGLVDRFLPLARDIGDLQVLVPALAIGSSVHAVAGNFETSVVLIDELRKRSDPTPNWRARFLPEAVRVLSAAGSLKLAEELILVEDQVATNRDRLSILTARALIAEAHDRMDEAERMYMEAAARWKEYGATLEHAQALLQGGYCALRLGHVEAAEGSLVEAKALFARLGAARSSDEAESTLLELAASNGARRPSPS